MSSNAVAEGDVSYHHDNNMTTTNNSPHFSPLTKSNPSKVKLSSSEASMKLWNRIHDSTSNSNGSSSKGSQHYRFAQSQRNRTLDHPCLVQPTEHDESLRRHEIASGRYTYSSKSSLASRATNVSSLNDNNEEKKENDEEADLKARLSAVLSRATHKPSSISVDFSSKNIIDEEDEFVPSPTSTLHFPQPTMEQQYGVSKDTFIQDQQESTNDTETTTYVCYPEQQTQTIAPQSPRPTTTEMEPTSPSHTFVICADTQIGMTSQNKEWLTELEYCQECIDQINSLHPRPKFVSVCGDLVDMEYTFEERKTNSPFSRQECDDIQNQQNEDFKKVWSNVHEDIALICLCGNHDVGNQPTPQSIQKFRNAFGDEYLAFWTNGTYNIVLNNVLFTNPTGAPDIFEEQLVWLEEQLKYASDHGATMIFIFGHHPWFLYHEEEDVQDFGSGGSAFPNEWGESTQKFPDSYFSVPKRYRRMALDLFQEYGVNAAFSGHFHQNLLSKTSWGMDMIVTGPLSMVFESDGKPMQEEVNERGMRVVTVEYPRGERGEIIEGNARFSHKFVPI